MEEKKQKIVALIGRPNVGKSTLFNRLVGRRIAIETPVPGTTRDRLFGDVNWRGENFTLVDVAGIEIGSKKEIEKSMQAGVDLAIESADLILFIVDWNEKENRADRAVARRLRAGDKKVLLVVNKADNIDRIQSLEEFKRLGFQEPIPVSGISGKSSGDLLDIIVKELHGVKKSVEKKEKASDIRLSIIGRPNVGKSTLLNAIIGEKRAIVSEEPGTTRDIISVNFFHDGKNILIADTAGIRRPGKIERDTIESFSVLRSESALKNSDVAVLVIDAKEGLVALDANILGKAKEWGKGIILAVNKIDLVPGDRDKYMVKMIWKLQRELNFVPWMPIVFISAKDEENIRALLNQVVNADESRKTIIPEEDLVQILEEAKKLNPQLELVKYLKQKKNNPPIFEVIFPKKGKPHYTQIRYLENKIRDIYPMNGSPIFIDLVGFGR